jgi:hypothetical protein
MITSGQQYSLVKSGDREITGRMHYRWVSPALRATRWIVCLAAPPDLPYQMVVKSGLTASLDGVTARQENEHSALRRKIFKLDAPAKSPTEITFDYEMTLRLPSVKLTTGGATADSATKQPQRDLDAYKKATPLFDFKEKPFQGWLKDKGLQRAKNERDIEFAWRVFSLLSERYQYEYRADQDRRASLICATNRTDCGGISGLFVSTMRANSVPARLLFGTWAYSDPPGQQLANAHVKAEFYAEGTGWVPVELSAMTGTNRPANPMDCFGTFNADFVTFHVDPDLVIDTGIFGRKDVGWLQLPAVWAAGQGNFDGSHQTYNWSVR